MSGYVCKGTRAMREKEALVIGCGTALYSNCIRVKPRELTIKKKGLFDLLIYLSSWLTLW